MTEENQTPNNHAEAAPSNPHQETPPAVAATQAETPAAHPHTEAHNQPDENQLKVVSAIGYLGILFLVPLLMFPKNNFAIFHANQGLLLFITAIALNVLMMFIGIFTFGFGFILSPLVWIALLILLILGIVNAMGGKMKRLPLIGGFDILTVSKD